MDNASFHHSERLARLCSNAGVKVVYLPPYSPDFKPIEECFSILKVFIREHWQEYEENTAEDFETFLE
jgi:transposase